MRTTIESMPSVSPVDFIGGVFPRRQLSIVASEPGCGKTWVMLQFCADISNEYRYSKFFGMSFVEKQRKSLMLIGDTGREMIVDRLQHMDIIKYVKSHNYIFYFASDMIKEKHPFLLNTRDGRSAIQGLIHQEKPDIVFFDTLISFMTADENSAKEIGELFIGLREIAEDENCAIVLNHHFRKTQGGHTSRKSNLSINDVIGSSAMSRLSSLMLAMVRDKSNPEKNLVNVVSVKTWYKELPSFSFEITSDEDGHVEILPNYAQGNILKARRLLTTLANQLQEGMLLSLDDISTTVHLRKDTCRAALNNLALYTPLTSDATCDRFYVTKTRRIENGDS